MWICTLESPDSIDVVVVGYRQAKTNGVCNVFVYLNLFFKKPGGTKIDGHSQKTRQPKFDDPIKDFHMLINRNQIKLL